MLEFKPQIMPLMYWALAFGAAAGVVLFIMYLLSEYILAVWMPVFLVGLVWGGWRNYQQQKKRWYEQAGTAPPAQSITQEFRQAATDIADASRELLNQEAQPETSPEELNTSADSALPDPQIEEPTPPEGR